MADPDESSTPAGEQPFRVIGSSPPAVRTAAPRSAARRRYRFRRRHTPHYYLALPSITAAAIAGAMNVIAFVSRSILLAEITFVVVAVTLLIICTAFFWGFYMIMSGHIPAARIKYIVPHGMVGVLAPLLYTLNISLGLDELGTTPVGIGLVICSLASFLLLCIQFTMGKLVVRPEPLRVVRKEATDG